MQNKLKRTKLSDLVRESSEAFLTKNAGAYI